MSYPLRIPELHTATDAQPLRVLIVSTDHLVGAALNALLKRQGSVEIGTADTANVALWDVRLGTELIDLQRLPTVAMIEEPSQAAPLLAAGARGVVLRTQVGPSVVAALQAARAGLAVVDADLAPAMISQPAPPQLPAGIETLTARESQVIELLTLGLSNKQVAAELNISNHTAKFHVNSILNKLDAATRTEAVVTAVRFGLVTL